MPIAMAALGNVSDSSEMVRSTTRGMVYVSPCRRRHPGNRATQKPPRNIEVVRMIPINRRLVWLAALSLLLPTVAAAQATSSTMAGTPEALAAADRLVEQVGGREVWARARSLRVVERVHHSQYGGPIRAEYSRDLVRPARHARLEGPGLQREDAWDATSGWAVRDGVVSDLAPDRLSAEVAGWAQEPYRVYRLLATRDPGVRVSLADGNRLVVHYADGRTLCWFVLDSSGAPMKWGNVWDGRINEAIYGPLTQFGALRMPAWGTSVDASWRFEYVEASVSDAPLTLPPRPSPRTTR